MIKYTKAIAQNSDLASAQVFVIKGLNFTLMLLISGVGEDVFVKIKTAVLDLEVEILESTDSIPTLFQGLLTNLSEKLADFESLSTLIAAWREDIVYFQQSQKEQTQSLDPNIDQSLSLASNEVYLYRSDQLTNLLPLNHNDQVISGHINPGDKILFVNSTLRNYLETDQKKIIQLINSNIDLFQDEINGLMLEINGPDPIATLLLESEKEELELEKAPEFDNLTSPSLEFEDQPKRNRELSSILPSINLRSILYPIKNLRFQPKIIAVLVLITLIILGTLITFLITNSQRFQKKQQINNLAAQAKTKIDLGLSLKDLNPAEAKKNLDEANQLLEQATKLDSKSSTVADLRDLIQSNTGAILKQNQINEWTKFLDLNLIKDSFTTNEMSLSLDQLLMLDPTQKTLITVNVTQKNNQILAGSRQLGEAKDSSINAEFAYSFSEDKGVVRVDVSNQSIVEAVKPDTEWGFIKDIIGFGRNIYLLDSIKSQIWKYVPVAAGYSDKQPYLKSEANLIDARKMQIDSSIWILKGDSEILKFTSGESDFFAFSDIEKPISKISTFFISDNTENIYIIDAPNSRLLSFKKSGEYVAEYFGDKFATALDLIVDEEKKIVYILEGKTIYQINL